MPTVQPLLPNARAAASTPRVRLDDTTSARSGEVDTLTSVMRWTGMERHGNDIAGHIRGP